MARSTISTLTSFLSFGFALTIHALAFGGAIYLHHKTTPQLDDRIESENIIYAEFIQEAAEDNDNNVLEPVRWVNPTKLSKMSPMETKSINIQENLDNLLIENNIQLITNHHDYLLSQSLDIQKEIIALAPIAVEPPFIIEKTKTSSAKKTRPNIRENIGQATTKGKGKSKINKGKTQSARCSVGRASSSQHPKKAAIIRIKVSPSGKKNQVQLLQSSGSSGFDRSALKAARAARCRPYIQNGKAKTAQVRITFR
ncbi:MAG: energy transducer TonB [Alphaproteobacteria bacterium]